MQTINSYSWPTLDLIQSRESLVNLQSQIQRLQITMRDRAYRDHDSLQTLASETRSNLSRLLLLRSCGFLEYSINTAVKEWTIDNHSLVYDAFIKPELIRGSKANKDRILTMMKIFAPQHLEDIKSFLEASRDGVITSRASEINEMIKFRNKISHGLSDQLDTEQSVSFSELSLEVGDKIIEFMNPYSS